VETTLHKKSARETDHKNVTLSLPEDLLRRFRVYAALRNESMSRLMTEAIRSLLAEAGGRCLERQEAVFGTNAQCAQPGHRRCDHVVSRRDQ